MGSNEKVNSNKLFCTLKISKGLIEYVQKKIKFFFVPVLTDAGTPTWWYTMAPAVLTFLTTNDFTGKTVIPFMTNGGWPGHVIKDMEENCKGAAFAHEMQIQFDSKGKDHLETSEEVITEWIGQINTDINK